MESKGPICQSCGMPMERPEDFGTHADGEKNRDYCHFCFDKGKFTDPNISMERMIEKVASMASKMNMSESKAKAMAKRTIPKLRRWQSK